MYRYALDAGLSKAQLGYNKNEMYNPLILLECAFSNVNATRRLPIECHIGMLIRVDPIPNLLFCGGRLGRRKRELTPEP
jgi:hypothetical protein